MSGGVGAGPAAAVMVPRHGAIRPLQAIVRDQATMVRSVQEGARVRVQMPGDVLFSFGSARLSARAARTLQAAERVLDERSARRVVVEGHTDTRGADRFN